MKSFLTFVAFLGSLHAQILAPIFQPQPSGGSFTAPVYVTSSYGNAAGNTCGNTCTQALGVNATSGDIIPFSAGWQGATTTISSVSGTNGTCLLLSATAWSDATNGWAGESGYCLPTSSAAYTVSFTMSTGTFNFASQVAEYSGQGSSPIDASNTTSPPTNCSGTSCNGPSVTTTQGNDLVVLTGFEYSGNAQNFIAGAGATLRSGTNHTNGLQDQTQATAGSVTPNFTSAGSMGVTGMSSIAIKGH